MTDKLCPGRVSTATNEENEAHLDKLMKPSRLITVHEMSLELGVSVSAVEKLILSRYTTGVLDGCTNAHSGTKRPPGDCQSEVSGTI